MGFDKDKMPFWINNFKYLDGLIHCGANEIVMDSDIVLSDGEESEYKDGIILNVPDFIIDGNGHVIDACGKTRIFLCRAKNVIIKNIIFKNGFAENGGAIYNHVGELMIAESAFVKNSAEWSGGAIASDMGKLTISESTFDNNDAEKGFAGAIASVQGELTITGSALTENVAKNGGGAICLKKPKKFESQNCTFRDNEPDDVFELKD